MQMERSDLHVSLDCFRFTNCLSGKVLGNCIAVDAFWPMPPFFDQSRGKCALKAIMPSSTQKPLSSVTRRDVPQTGLARHSRSPTVLPIRTQKFFFGSGNGRIFSLNMFHLMWDATKGTSNCVMLVANRPGLLGANDESWCCVSIEGLTH